MRDRGREGAAAGRTLEPLIALARLRRRERGEVDPDGHAIVLARADREHRRGRTYCGKAHYGFVHRADLLDAQGTVGDALAAEHQQVVEHAQHATVADGEHLFRIAGAVAAEQEGKGVLVEQRAAARLHEARGMAAINQPEQCEQPAPGAAAFVDRVGVERVVVA